jgi:hypothetical protein
MLVCVAYNCVFSYLLSHVFLPLYTGIAKDEWQRTAELLTKHHNKPGYSVKVTYDDEGLITMI